MFSPLKAFAAGLALLATLVSAAIGGLAAQAVAWFVRTRDYRYVLTLGLMSAEA